MAMLFWPMDAYTAILTRRSIRKYTEAPVSDDVTEQLLRAAMFAPSAANKQQNIVPFSLVVLGYPAEEHSQPDRYQPERIHKGNWQA